MLFLTTIFNPNCNLCLYPGTHIYTNYLKITLTQKIKQTCPIHLLFSDPPSELSITGYSAGDVIREGALRRIKCTALSGNPLPGLEWLAGNKKVEGAKIEKAESGTFVSSEISIKVDRSDNGKTYHCRAQNKATREPFTKSVQLSVRNAVNDIES